MSRIMRSFYEHKDEVFTRRDGWEKSYCKYLRKVG